MGDSRYYKCVVCEKRSVVTLRKDQPGFMKIIPRGCRHFDAIHTNNFNLNARSMCQGDLHLIRFKKDSKWA
jgi:hypothetical protein